MLFEAGANGGDTFTYKVMVVKFEMICFMKIKPGLHEFFGRFPFQNSTGIEAYAGMMPIGRVQQKIFLSFATKQLLIAE